jgi:hypothetical protein
LPCLPFFLMKTYRMRFSGRAFCSSEKRYKHWNKGQILKGEFDSLLPDTFVMNPQDTMAESKPRPITTQRKEERPIKTQRKKSINYSLKELKEIIPTISDIDSFIEGDTRKGVQKLCSQ